MNQLNRYWGHYPWTRKLGRAPCIAHCSTQALVPADLVQPSVLMQDNLGQGGGAQNREMEHMGHGHQLAELWPGAKRVLLFFCPNPVPWDKEWLI